jgi:nitrate/nitrite transporter NarK
MVGYGSQLNEAGYAVTADIVDGAELGEIARFAGGLVCDRAGTRRLIELPWCRELAVRFCTMSDCQEFTQPKSSPSNARCS